jgi:hypothetical protein
MQLTFSATQRPAVVQVLRITETSVSFFSYTTAGCQITTGSRLITTNAIRILLALYIDRNNFAIKKTALWNQELLAAKLPKVEKK